MDSICLHGQSYGPKLPMTTATKWSESMMVENGHMPRLVCVYALATLLVFSQCSSNVNFFISWFYMQGVNTIHVWLKKTTLIL